MQTSKDVVNKTLSFWQVLRKMLGIQRVNEVAIILQSAVFLWKFIWPKRTHKKSDYHRHLNNLSEKKNVLANMGDYSSYSSVTDMIGRLGWRTLEQRRTDSRLVLFYKIIYMYGYVAVPPPSYVIALTSAPQTSHPLAYRQIPTSTNYYITLSTPSQSFSGTVSQHL